MNAVPELRAAPVLAVEPTTVRFLGMVPGESWQVPFMVSAEDLEDGEPGDCWDCPVVRALSRLLPGLIVSVTGSCITVYADPGDGDPGPVVAAARIPRALGVYIVRVDNRKAPGPEPFTVLFTRA